MEETDTSRPHFSKFGDEPLDPRLPLNILPAPLGMDDGARLAVIDSPAARVSSGTLPPATQDRVGLKESLPGITHFRVTFNVAGTFHYICAIHDELGMKGTVIVQ